MRSSKSRSRNKNRNRPQGGGNVVNRVFDSSGPEGKVRGTPAQIIEKYTQLARDAQLSGDRVALENFQQHSEHYTRMLAAAQKELDTRQGNGHPNQPQDDRQGERPGGHGGYGGQGNQGAHQDQARRGDVSEQPYARDGGQRDGGQPEASAIPGEQGQRDGPGGRRGGRRREQGEDRDLQERGDDRAAHDRGDDRGSRERGEDRGSRERGEDRGSQGAATEVIEPVETDSGPVPTPEGEQDAARADRPKRARTRRKAPAPTGDEGGSAASADIDDSAA